MASQATQILGPAFFKHKYLTNPLVTPENLVIAVAKNLALALETSIPQHLQVSTIQALKDLSEVFMDVSHKYSNDPIIHMPNVPPLHPHQEPMESPRVSPTPLGTSPPRVHTTTISLKVPGTLTNCAPSSIPKSLFPPDVSSVGLQQNIAKHQLGTAPRSPTNSNSSHLENPTPAAPISHQIKPHVPFSSLTKLHQSQQKADLGILDNKVYPVDGPACNIRSQTQVRKITQDAVLACIHNYGEVMGRPVMACCTALQQYPSDMLHTVLNKTTGHFMEMQRLLVNLKYKELWGESYTKNSDVLLKASPESAKVPTLLFSSKARTFHTATNGTSRTRESVYIITQRRRTPTAHKSLWVAISSTTPATAAHLLST
jgi:hypothetical protein